MEFEGRIRGSHIPNLTPLIDIVFLLLVFFMLTAHFVREEAFTIDLPDAESSIELNEKKPIEITVGADGRLNLSGKDTTLGSLANELSKLLKSSEKRSVTIRGDKGVPLGTVISVFDAARKAGAESVDIITEER